MSKVNEAINQVNHYFDIKIREKIKEIVEANRKKICRMDIEEVEITLLYILDNDCWKRNYEEAPDPMFASHIATIFRRDLRGNVLEEINTQRNERLSLIHQMDDDTAKNIDNIAMELIGQVSLKDQTQANVIKKELLKGDASLESLISLFTKAGSAIKNTKALQYNIELFYRDITGIINRAMEDLQFIIDEYIAMEEIIECEELSNGVLPPVDLALPNAHYLGDMGSGI